MAPFADALLAQKRSRPMLRLGARLLRARHERGRTRTLERSLVQMQQVVEATEQPQPPVASRMRWAVSLHLDRSGVLGLGLLRCSTSWRRQSSRSHLWHSRMRWAVNLHLDRSGVLDLGLLSLKVQQEAEATQQSQPPVASCMRWAVDLHFDRSGVLGLGLLSSKVQQVVEAAEQPQPPVPSRMRRAVNFHLDGWLSLKVQQEAEATQQAQPPVASHMRWGAKGDLEKGEWCAGFRPAELDGAARGGGLKAGTAVCMRQIMAVDWRRFVRGYDVVVGAKVQQDFMGLHTTEVQKSALWVQRCSKMRPANGCSHL